MGAESSLQERDYLTLPGQRVEANFAGEPGSSDDAILPCPVLHGNAVNVAECMRAQDLDGAATRAAGVDAGRAGEFR
jgi:hypothetical protein